VELGYRMAKLKDELLNLSSEESQSEDDEDGWKVTEAVEKEFYKTLNKIKKKDPTIYDKNVDFFKDVSIPESKEGKSKSSSFTLRDYERKIIVEKGGELSDEEPSSKKLKNCKLPTYVEEQESLKNSIKAALNSDGEDDSEEQWGGLFKKRQKTKEEKGKEEETYKEWLKGQKDCEPKCEESEEMKQLHDYWTNPNLDKEEKFLRDYVLNKKFLDGEEEDNLSTENIADEMEKCEQDDVQPGHTFEEPDQEFIQRYPRVMENSVRRKNEHRKEKRIEVRERKRKEKQKKKSEIQKRKKEKKKEIEDKIEELKKLTGNDQLAFENALNADFDIDEHDKIMNRILNDEFYSHEDPSFNPNVPGRLEDEWNEELHEDTENINENNDDFNLEEQPEETFNCEDPSFNMDCDYDPDQNMPKETKSRSRRRKDKHRRTTVSEAVRKQKPVFDPARHSSFQKYVDHYYGIDCEDFIGDMPCRFKYRRTIPNSYGLTVEEILSADEKELERWCSIKRIHQLRPDFKEKGDLKVFNKKGTDEALKRKILPSLFKMDNKNEKLKKNETITSVHKQEVINEDKVDENVADSSKITSILKPAHDKSKACNNKEKVTKNKSKLGKERISLKRKLEAAKNSATTSKKNKRKVNHSNIEMSLATKTPKGTKTNQKNKIEKEESTLYGLSDARLQAYGIKPKKFRNKLKYGMNSS